MLQMFLNPLRLFLRGSLFRDNASVFRQWLKGWLLTLALIVGLGWLFSPLAGVIVGSMVGGALLPFLFKNLKYN
jgi:uncharacterized protein involved in cysteine biosynthesis